MYITSSPLPIAVGWLKKDGQQNKGDNKMDYNKAEIEIIKFNNEDIITTSGWNNNGNGNGNGNWKPEKPGNGGHKN